MSWLDKYEEGGYLGTTNKGFDYNGAWGGQFQEGGTKKKILKTADKVVKASLIGKVLDFIPGAETVYDVANTLNSYSEGDYKKIASNTIGALLPGVSGKAVEAISEDWLPETPEIEKSKMRFNLNTSPSDRMKYLEKYGPGYLNNPQFIKDFKLESGGSLPGSVGFTYARTKGIPSEGPYAKKTMPSAQNGQEMRYFQEGLDWRPKTISRNGGWLDGYDEAQTGKQVLANDKRALEILEDIQKRKQGKSKTTQVPLSRVKNEREEAVRKVDNSRATPKAKVTDVNKLNVRNKTKAELAEQERINDEAIAAERRAIRERANANPLNQGVSGFFNPENHTRQNWEDANSHLESQFRVSDKPNFFDDWMNPLNAIGGMAADLGAAPNQIVQQDSMAPLVGAIATPLLTGAIEGFGAKSNKQFVNNLVNPFNIVPGYSSAEKYISSKIPSKIKNLPKLGKELGEQALEDVQSTFKLAKQLKEVSTKPGVTFSNTSPGENAIKMFNQVEEGAKTIQDALSHRIQMLKTPEGRKRLVQQEYEYLKKIGFNETGIARQAEINADNRIAELQHSEVFGNKNARVIENIDKNSLSKNIMSQDPVTSEFRYNFIEEGIPGNNAHFAQSESIPFGDMLLDSNLKRAIELEEKYGKNSMFSEILNKINVGPSVGGYEVPGDIAMGVGFSKSKPIVNHEIQHALQRSRTLAIDDELKALEAKNNDILSEDELGALDYFQTGSKGKESSAFLAEARTAMKEAGLIKNDYDEISPELVKEAMEYFKKNPQKILLKEKNSFPFRELSQTRIFDIHAPTDFNYNLLSKSFNKLPAMLPIGLGLGAASQLNNEETPQYKQGGVIKDDRGQWDHPGEITQIDSPYITMKGVPYPVLGVSNTGDVQMMYPEQEYEFDGDSVIEYPMARNGINNLDARPLVKLDQLTNFTNYNTKQPGAWLDKYQKGGDILDTSSSYVRSLRSAEMQSGPQEEPIQDYDRIAALPATNTGVAKNIPIPVDGGYVVKKGDTLSKIAKESGVPLNTLAKVNKIKNVDQISVNQKLLLPAVAQTKPLPEKYQDWNVIKKKTNLLNKLSDLSKIVSYHKSTPNEIYSVVDKKNSKLLIYQGDKLLKSFEVGTGQNPGDAQTVTKVVNGKTNWDSGNKSTGAGIYTVSNVDPSSDAYYGLPSFNLKNEQGIEVATSIHGTPKGRRKYFNNNTLTDNRMSNGCVNGKCQDLPEMYNYLTEGTKIYILPEDKGNSFEIVDGKPVFRVDPKNSKKYESYIDSKGKTQKGQGVNRTTNTLVYKPIKPVFNEEKFKDDVFTTFDFNDEKEYNKTTKPFVKSLTDNKKAIMKAAQIPSDVYNELAKMAFGIYGTESNYGDTHSAVGNFSRAVGKFISPSNSSSPDYEAKATTYGADEDTRSVGLTQIRWSYLNKKEKEVLKKLGITSNKDFLDPKKAAIGTTAVLGVRYNEQLTSDQKKDIWKNLPTKWNRRENYPSRVKANSSYLNFEQLD